MDIRPLLAAALAASLCLAAPASAAEHRLTEVVPLGGPPRWDYLKVDPQARRLYVAHGSEVTVLGLDERKIVGRVPGLAGAHGVALAPDRDLGFVANGDRNTLTTFSLSTLTAVAETPVGADPDSVTYDPVTNRVFVFNGESRDATVVDATSRKPLKTLPLGGTPEFAVADGKGSIFVNIEEGHEVVRLDTRKMAVAARLPIEGCEAPHALAIDLAKGRLFSACANAVLAVLDAATGKQLGSVKIGRDADAIAFDEARGEILVSNGEGFVSVIGPKGDGYEVKSEVQTRQTARTLAVDPKTGAFFTPAVEFDIDWSNRTAVFAPEGLKLYIFDRR